MKRNNIDIKAMPKVELHVHIEGAVSPTAYFELAKKNNVKLPVETLEQWKNYFKFKNFSHFIEVYITAVSCIKTPQDLSVIIEDFYKHQSSQNILYSEAFLSASFLIQNFETKEVLEAIEAGMKAGEEKYKVKVNIIPDIARNLPDSQEGVLNLVKAGYKRGTFIGLGLGGLEIGYPPHLFKETYKAAKEAGLKIVAHAGEAVGAESIWGAINDLHIERIGHGIRCIEDEVLMKQLKENQIPIEVSPTSNYHLGVVNAQENHPIREMFDKGLFCTLNSDDPVMFSTNLVKEYELLLDQGFSNEELIQLNRNAIHASFLNQEEKAKYEKLLDDFLIS